MNTEIKPCPFCKQNTVLCASHPQGLWYVSCHTCCATGPNELTQEAAIAAWNLRAPEPLPEEPPIGKFIGKLIGQWEGEKSTVTVKAGLNNDVTAISIETLWKPDGKFRRYAYSPEAMQAIISLGFNALIHLEAKEIIQPPDQWQDISTAPHLRIQGEQARLIILNTQRLVRHKFRKCSLWSLVGQITGHGSGHSIEICKSAGFDPHQPASNQTLLPLPEPPKGDSADKCDNCGKPAQKGNLCNWCLKYGID